MATFHAWLSTLPRETLRMAAWLVLLMVIFVPLERLWGLHRQKIVRKHFLADVGFYFLSSLLPSLLLVLPLSLVAGMVHRLAPLAFYTWVATIPFTLRQGIALIVAEIGTYWAHRLSHQVPFLWRFHAIHHDAEELDWLVHTRAHPVDMFFTRLCGLVPVYLLGLAQPASQASGGMDPVPYAVIFLTTVWGFFIHANIRWRLGLMENVLASPRFHHWHHTSDNPAVINKNYAANFPWIDRCFHSFYLPAKQWPRGYGIRPGEPAPVRTTTVEGMVAEATPAT